MNPKGNISGFTLIELVIVIIAFGVIGGISVGILRSAADIYVDVVNRGAVVNSNRTALWRMVREISLQQDKNHLQFASRSSVEIATPRDVTLKYDMSEDKVRLTKNQGSAHELADDLVSSNSSLIYRGKTGYSFTLFPLDFSERQEVMLFNLEIETALGDDTFRLRTAIFAKNLHHGERMPYHE